MDMAWYDPESPPQIQTQLWRFSPDNGAVPGPDAEQGEQTGP